MTSLESLRHWFSGHTRLVLEIVAGLALVAVVYFAATSFAADPAPLPGPVATSTPDVISTELTPEQQKAKLDIENTFVAFFSAGSDSKTAVTYIQDGNGLLALLQSGGGNSDLYDKLSTRVVAVAFLEPSACTERGLPEQCAQVTHDVLIDDVVARADQRSYAVQRSGKWLIARESVCELLEVTGRFCPQEAPGG